MNKNKVIKNKQDEVFVMVMPMVGEHWLVPYDGSKYWEYLRVPKDKWIAISTIDFNDYDITKEEYLKIKADDIGGYAEILTKYHASF